MAKLLSLHRSFTPDSWTWFCQVRGTAIAVLGRSFTLGGGLLASTVLFAAAAPRGLPAVQPQAAPESTPIPLPKQTPPVVPPLPNAIPAPLNPEVAGIITLTPAPSDGAGLGHLRPTDLTSLIGNHWPQSPLLGADWLRGVALPIYPSPESAHWGWLINGWLIPNDAAPLAIGRDATFSMVPIDRHIYTFPVLEVRPDGWFRFQYTPAGTAWAHTSHLSLGSVRLTVETWEAYMEDATRVEFRRPGLSQPMRLAPSGTAPLQALVGPNSLIQPLVMEGDWLRVRVTQPVQGCMPLPGASTEEGWVRWRDEAKTPLVLVPGSGC